MPPREEKGLKKQGHDILFMAFARKPVHAVQGLSIFDIIILEAREEREKRGSFTGFEVLAEYPWTSFHVMDHTWNRPDLRIAVLGSVHPSRLR
jgi:hypothetical protein